MPEHSSYECCHLIEKIRNFAELHFFYNMLNKVEKMEYNLKYLKS